MTLLKVMSNGRRRYGTNRGEEQSPELLSECKNQRRRECVIYGALQQPADSEFL